MSAAGSSTESGSSRTACRSVPTMIANTLNVDNYSQVPDRIASGAIANPSPAAWFDVTAFRVPAPYEFGNSGLGVLTGPGWWVATCHSIRTSGSRKREGWYSGGNYSTRSTTTIPQTRIPALTPRRALPLILPACSRTCVGCSSGFTCTSDQGEPKELARRWLRHFRTLRCSTGV